MIENVVKFKFHAFEKIGPLKIRYIPSKVYYHKVYKIFKNETGVRDIPDLLVCTPPKAGTTNWSKVLWQLKYLNELGILVDKDDKKYINYTNVYKLWFRKTLKNFERSERGWKIPDTTISETIRS